MTNIYDIIQDAISDFEDRIKDNEDATDIGDIIHEVADWWVPVYYYKLLQAALSDISLAIRVPELWPAFNGENTPVNLIAANIYERIVEELWKYYNEKLK